MGLVKTRRLAAMYKQQRAKAGMKLPAKFAARERGDSFLLRDGRRTKGRSSK